MSSIESMLVNKGAWPYFRPLKVKRVTVEEEDLCYSGGDGSRRHALSCAVSDGDRTAKWIYYDQAQF